MPRIPLAKLSAWRNIKAPPAVLNWLEHGVEIPFVDNIQPPKFQLENKVPESEREFVSKKTSYWVTNAMVEEVPSADSLKAISPLQVQTREFGDTKKSLILNTQELNRYVDTPRLKAGSMMSALRSTIRPGDWLLKVDLLSGFSHLPLHRGSIPFIGFEWNDRFYQYTVLPSGLSISAFCFNSTMQTVMNHISRNFGCRVVRFTDDWLFMADSCQHSERLSKDISELFDSLGLEVGDRSRLTPSQEIKFVQSTVSTRNGIELSISREKLEQVRNRVVALLVNGRTQEVSVRDIARVCGYVQSAVEFGAPEGIKALRSLYKDLGKKTSWDDNIRLSEESLQDLAMMGEILDHELAL